MMDFEAFCDTWCKYPICWEVDLDLNYLKGIWPLFNRHDTGYARITKDYEPLFHPIIAIQEAEMVLDELYCDFIRLFDDMLLKPSKIIGAVLGDDYIEYP